MKRNFLLFLFSLALVACNTSDDESTGDNTTDDESTDVDPTDDAMDDNEPTLKLYQNSTVNDNDGIEFQKDVVYNENNRIQTIHIVETDFKIESLEFSYSGDQIISVDQDVHYTFNDTFFSQVIDVTNVDGRITLIESENDLTVEIDHSNGYVDATRAIITSSNTVVFENAFLRDSNDNIVSIQEGSISYTYSNFDSGKQNDPFGASMTYEYNDFFKAFNLKVSKDNPRTEFYSHNGNTATRQITLEYDADGYVTRKEFVENSDVYVLHEYIEL